VMKFEGLQKYIRMNEMCTGRLGPVMLGVIAYHPTRPRASTHCLAVVAVVVGHYVLPVG